MKQVVIKIHSFVDVITNSSTVIYVQSTKSTVKMAKDLISALLKAANIDKTADDLFDIYVEQDKDHWEYEDGETLTETEKNDPFREDDDDCGYVHNNLIIKPKICEQETINLTEQVEKIFNIAGTYDG